MVDAYTFSCRKTLDVIDLIRFFDWKESKFGLGKSSLNNALERDDHTALKKDRQAFLKRTGKTFFGCNANFSQTVWLLYFVKPNVLRINFFDYDSILFFLIYFCVLHLLAAMPQSASN